MGEGQRQALARLFTEDEDFRAAMGGATSVEDAVRIAGAYGIAVAAQDLTSGSELSDSELETVSGGTLLHPTMVVFCGTAGDFCTFNPYACAS